MNKSHPGSPCVHLLPFKQWTSFMCASSFRHRSHSIFSVCLVIKSYFTSLSFRVCNELHRTAFIRSSAPCVWVWALFEGSPIMIRPFRCVQHRCRFLLQFLLCFCGPLCLEYCWVMGCRGRVSRHAKISWRNVSHGFPLSLNGIVYCIYLHSGKEN